MDAPNTGEVLLKVEVDGRVWAQFSWSEVSVLLSSLLIAISCVNVGLSQKNFQGVNWPNSSFYVTLNGSQIQDHFSSPYGSVRSCRAAITFSFLKHEGLWFLRVLPLGAAMFSLLCSQSSHPRAFCFCYLEPLHNQAEEPLLPEVVDLYIGANLKCPVVSPEIACDNHIILPTNPVNIHVAVVLVLGRDEGV